MYITKTRRSSRRLIRKLANCSLTWFLLTHPILHKLFRPKVLVNSQANWATKLNAVFWALFWRWVRATNKFVTNTPKRAFLKSTPSTQCASQCQLFWNMSKLTGEIDKNSLAFSFTKIVMEHFLILKTQSLFNFLFILKTYPTLQLF